MKAMQALGLGATAATAFCAAFAFAGQPKVVLNAKQLELAGLDLDLDEETSVSTGDVALGDMNVDALFGDSSADAASDALGDIVQTVDEGADGAANLVVADAAQEEELPVLAEAPAAAPDAAVLVAVEDDSAEDAGADPVSDAVADLTAAADIAAMPDEPQAPAAPVSSDAPALGIPVVEAPVVAAVPAEPPVAAPEAVEAPAPVAVVAEPVAAVAEPVAAVAEPVAEGPAEVDPLEQSAAEMATLEKSRRDLFIQHARENYDEGVQNLKAGNWSRAADSFKEAIKFYEHVDTSATHAMLEQSRLQLGEAYYRIGNQRVDDIESNREGVSPDTISEAETAANLAIKLGHPKGKKLLDHVKDLQANPPKPPVPPRKKRQHQEEYRANVRDWKARLREAREFYATGEYDKCREKVELVLSDYPWNNDALALLRKLANREHQWKDAERRTTRDDMLRAVTEDWNARTYAVDFTSGDAGVSVSGADGDNPSKPDLGPEMRIREKMNRIVLPEVDFRQANVADVIAFLSEASRDYDQEDTPNEERGVNFVLDLGDGGAAETQAAAVDDPWAPAPAAASSASVGGIPTITIKSRYVTLLSTLDTIMELSRLKYRVQGNVVMIMPRNRAEGDLIHRMYNVLPNIVERTVSLGGSNASGSGDSGDPFAISTGEVKATTDWKAFFSKLGVAWPDESTVEYMPSIGKLVVKNTASNLATLEQVLGALNVTPFQVEIEVRFVEVGQTDLNSLGLEWILNDDWEIAEKKSDAGLPSRSRRRIVMGAQNVTGGFNFLTGNSSQNINNANPVADGIAKVSSILTNPELSVVLHALANKSSADLLSAPKVVAQNGSQATIKSVTEYIYPTEFEVDYPDIDTSGDGDATVFSLPAVEPQSFQTREVGVILQVTPRVSADGNRISLDLTPSVVSEPSWKDYGYTYPLSYGSDEGFHLTMEQPFFPVRSLATSVDIYNGATVVMGGMITEERFGEEDKIPILGDIPLLGRLFRYKYEQSEKRNLLIFVSARLVDPAGREVKGTDNSILGLDAANGNN